VITVGLSACGGSGDATDAPTTSDAGQVSTIPDTIPAVEQPQSSETVTAATTATTEIASPAADVAIVVPEALQFTAPLVGGGEIDLASLAGKPVILWFWAPWCPICNREADSIRDAAEHWAGQAEFVGVAWQGSDDEYNEFIDRYSLTMPHIEDDSGEYFTRFGIPSQPGFAIVLPDGEVQTLLGAADRTILDSLISSAAA